jgi:SAM-dependent methyltransferase
MNDDILGQVADYYQRTLRLHGATPQGVDWSSERSQLLRFEQLLAVRQQPGPCTLNDYGCGYGALADYLTATAKPFEYCGYDIAPEMVAAARQRFSGHANCRFETDRRRVRRADYTVASGIFNVKGNRDDAVWTTYVREVLHDIAILSSRGFAFNLLTTYSDPERRRADLYYADPCETFDYCKRHFSTRVALLHDYPLYEFTIIVRLEE